MIACFGDSLTAGKPGVSYLHFLPENNYVNHGVGGDTLKGVSRRIKKYIEKQTCDGIIIQVGANDILLPYMRNSSDSWKKAANFIITRGSIPTPNKNEFIQVYEELIHYLVERNIPVYVITIPCLSEMCESPLNIKVNDFNEAIRNLAAKLEIKLIDFNKWQKSIIVTKEYAGNAYFISLDYKKMLLDTMASSTPDKAEKLAHKRDLTLTVDGVHLNKRGAQGLAHLIEQNL